METSKMAKTSFLEELQKYCIANISEENVSSWFVQKLATIDASLNSFFIAFGMVNKKIERKSVELTGDLLVAIQEVNPAFDSSDWTLDELCRLLLLLKLKTEANKEKIVRLIESSDMREQVVIYKSLQYLENAEAFLPQMVDGVRTNMIDVFDAISLKNSYPFRYFSQGEWNQVVLKSIFMERPLYTIYGLEEKNNQTLTDTLQDFVHERWAAGRLVNPEVWRIMNGFVSDAVFEDLEKVISSDMPLAQSAAIRVITESGNNEQKEWLKTENLSASLTWNEIGEEVRKQA